ncbi:hypothetical protein STEG23_003563 [Scotinomys teguina]
MVKVIESKEAFQEALVSAGDKLVVVDFSATWCGPCKMIKPFFHSLSEKYSSVVFPEVDVDDCQDVAAECEVKCMPTFQFYKKGQKAQRTLQEEEEQKEHQSQRIGRSVAPSHLIDVKVIELVNPPSVRLNNRRDLHKIETNTPSC